MDNTSRPLAIFFLNTTKSTFSAQDVRIAIINFALYMKTLMPSSEVLVVLKYFA